MSKYESVIILNPNLSSKADYFLKDFETLLSSNSFKILKTEDVGRRQLAYSINNHNKGHYLLFNLEGDPSKLILSLIHISEPTRRRGMSYAVLFL